MTKIAKIALGKNGPTHWCCRFLGNLHWKLPARKFLQEELLRKIALEEQIELQRKYTGQANILIPDNDFLRGYFQSIIPFVRNPAEKITRSTWRNSC